MHQCTEVGKSLNTSVILSFLYGNVRQNINTKTLLKIDMRQLKDTLTVLWIEVVLHPQLGSYAWFIYVSVSIIVLILILVIEQNLP